MLYLAREPLISHSRSFPACSKRIVQERSGPEVLVRSGWLDLLKVQLSPLQIFQQELTSAKSVRIISTSGSCSMSVKAGSPNPSRYRALGNVVWEACPLGASLRQQTAGKRQRWVQRPSSSVCMLRHRYSKLELALA